MLWNDGLAEICIRSKHFKPLLSSKEKPTVVDTVMSPLESSKFILDYHHFGQWKCAPFYFCATKWHVAVQSKCGPCPHLCPQTLLFLGSGGKSFKDGFVSENGSCVDSPHIDFVEPFDFPLPLPQKVVARDFTLPLSLPNLLKDWEGISAFFRRHFEVLAPENNLANASQLVQLLLESSPLATTTAETQAISMAGSNNKQTPLTRKESSKASKLAPPKKSSPKLVAKLKQTKSLKKQHQ